MSKSAMPAAPERKVATLASLSDSLREGVRSVPSNEEFTPPAIEARRAASTYLDADLFRLEQTRVFRKVPLPVALSAMLPERENVLALDAYNVPVLLTRGKDGVARAFLNTCQHRGAKVVEGCTLQKASRVTCPFHAWTYALDGRLAGVPREETFKNLNKAERGLAALPCQEAGGFIWVILDPNAPADFSEVTPEIVRDLNALGFLEAHIYGRHTFELKANWKLVLEPFCEPYHVQRLHAQSLRGFFGDVPSFNQTLGKHFIQISGKADFSPEKLNAPNENVHKHITFGVHLFPCTLAIMSPYYTSVLFIMPVAVDKTIVELVMITPTPPDNPKAEDVYARSFEMILKVFGTEDFRAAESMQVGLAAGGLKELVYCGLEQNIPLFYERFDPYLQD